MRSTIPTGTPGRPSMRSTLPTRDPERAVRLAHQIDQRTNDVIQPIPQIIGNLIDITCRLRRLQIGQRLPRRSQRIVIPCPPVPPSRPRPSRHIERHRHTRLPQLPGMIPIKLRNTIRQRTNIAHHLQTNRINPRLCAAPGPVCGARAISGATGAFADNGSG